MASISIDDEQGRAFQLALAERLGLDPKQISTAGFTIEFGPGGGKASIRWEGRAHLPADEVHQMLISVRSA